MPMFRTASSPDAGSITRPLASTMSYGWARSGAVARKRSSLMLTESYTRGLQHLIADMNVARSWRIAGAGRLPIVMYDYYKFRPPRPGISSDFQEGLRAPR